jgi:hypothetical protein
VPNGTGAAVLYAEDSAGLNDGVYSQTRDSYVFVYGKHAIVYGFGGDPQIAWARAIRCAAHTQGITTRIDPAAAVEAAAAADHEPVEDNTVEEEEAPVAEEPAPEEKTSTP